MSNYVNSGSLESDTTTGTAICRGWATLSAHLTSGTGTLTWQFKGPDNTWRSIYAGADGTTEQVFTASHMLDVYFGDEVRVRAVGSSGSSPVWKWQLLSNVSNRYS
jgi:hypothetical protein